MAENCDVKLDTPRILTDMKDTIVVIKNPEQKLQENSIKIEVKNSKMEKSETNPLKLELKCDDEKINPLEKIKIKTVNRPDMTLTTYVIKKQENIKVTDLNLSSQAIVPVNRGDSKSFNVKLVKIDPLKYISTCSGQDTNSTDKSSIKLESPTPPIQLKISEKSNDPVNRSEFSAGESHNPIKLKRANKDVKKVLNDSKEPTQCPSDSTSTPTETKPRKLKRTREIFELNDSTKSVTSRDNSPSEENSNDCSNSSETSPNSTNSQLLKRNMRSQNAEFSLKQQKFLNRINNDNELSDNSDDENTDKMSEISVKSIENRLVHPPPKPGWDAFCWRCHTDGGQLIACKNCKRSHHTKCLKVVQIPENHDEFACPECLEAESSDSSTLMKNGKKKLSIEHLSFLLGFALKRMFHVTGSNVFTVSIDKTVYIDYENYVVHPMTLNMLQANINNRKYKCIETFMHDCKYLLHNCVIYPAMAKHKPIAKSLLKVVRQELSEIETCSECYQNANTSTDWFVEVCSKPHILLWAKLKGFPHWPAKGMAVNSNGLVDVRFFGAHDRAWVPIKDCYLYSEKDPNISGKAKRNNIAECIKEVDVHISKLKEKFGEFVHAPFMTSYDPANEPSQLLSMLPNYKEPISVTSPSPESSSKSKLTLKIIKMADNNLSIASDNTPEVTDKVEKYEICHKNVNNTSGGEPIVNQTDSVVSPTAAGKLETMVFKRKSDNGSWKKVLPPGMKKVKPSSEPENIKRKRSVVAIENENSVKKSKLENAEEVSQTSVVSISSESEKSLDSIDASKKVRKTYERKTRSKSIMKIKESTENGKCDTEEKEKTDSGKEETPTIDETDSSMIRRESLAREAKTRLSKKASNVTTTTPKQKAETEKINIKPEPVSEDEMNSTEQTNNNTDNGIELRLERITVRDITELTNDSNCNKKKTIILTPIEPDESIRKPKPAGEENPTRKPFPNKSRSFVNPAPAAPSPQFQKILHQMNSNNSMVFIPKNLKEETNKNSSSTIPSTSSSVLTSSNSNTSTSVAQTSNQISAKAIQNVPKLCPIPKANSDPPTSQTPVQQKENSVKSVEILENGQGPSRSVSEEPTNMLTETAGIPTALAAAITDAISTGPPKLTQRPSGPLRSSGDAVYPSEAGRVTRILADNSHRMTDFFRSVIEDTLSDLAGSSSNMLEAKVRLLEAENEKLKFQHQQEINKLKHNTDTILIEMRNSMENEKSKLVNEVRRQCEIERIRAVERAIEDTKKKQWCSNCGKEAEFYCCWNTSYCDLPCQQAHWPKHMVKCSQTQGMYNSTVNKPKAAITSPANKDDRMSKVIMKKFPSRTLGAAPRVDNSVTMKRIVRPLTTNQPQNDTKRQTRMHLPSSVPQTPSITPTNVTKHSNSSQTYT